MFETSFISESKPKDRFGWFVFKESKYDDATLKTAASYLEKIKPEFVVRKESTGALTTWNMDGKVRVLKEGEIPQHILDGLSVGGPVLKLSRPPLKVQDLHLQLVHDLSLQGDFASAIRNNQLERTIWCRLGTPSVPFVNVRVNNTVRFNVGSLEAKEDTKATIEGIPFMVTTIEPVPGVETSNRIVVNQRTQNPMGDYELDLRVDSAKFKLEHPSEKTREQLNRGAESSNALGPFVIKQHRMSSNRPIKYWKNISVYRTSVVRGYIGHVPTSPR